MDASDIHNDALEWDYGRNSEDPNSVSSRSTKKMWWRCTAEGHHVQMPVGQVADGLGCYYCSGHRVLTGFNDISTTHPHILELWSVERNSTLPTEVSRGSTKKVWWGCSEGHEWEAAVSKIVAGRRCPYCSGTKVLSGYNDVFTTIPELEDSWDFEMNQDLDPRTVSAGSGKEAWWRCDIGHSYYTTIKRRSKYGCPYCAGTKVLSGYNDLASKNPEVSELWDFEKNEDTPSDVTEFSTKRRWWICKLGHSWESMVSNISSGSRCPKCSGHSSKMEAALRTEIDSLTPAIGPYTIPIPWEKSSHCRVDIYVPEHKLVVEYDGAYWHKGREGDDLAKTEALLDAGYRVARVREEGLSPLPLEGRAGVLQLMGRGSRDYNLQDEAIAIVRWARTM